MKILVGILIILHGLVHLVYVGQSWRLFELRPGMLWPDGSWSFSRLIGNRATRVLAGILCTVTTILFVISGAGLLTGKLWWHQFVIASIILSTFLYLFFWDGRLHKLNDKGWYAIPLNIAVYVATFFY